MLDEALLYTRKGAKTNKQILQTFAIELETLRREMPEFEVVDLPFCLYDIYLCTYVNTWITKFFSTSDEDLKPPVKKKTPHVQIQRVLIKLLFISSK